MNRTLVSLAALIPLAASAAPPAPVLPIEQYLTTPGAEEVLARSAAPASISDQATVLVLTSHGYTTVAQGTNGFTCLVERSWMSPFASPEFWNPKMRGPVCYNPAASKSILEYTRFRTTLALAGRTKEQMLEDIRDALGELGAPRNGEQVILALGRRAFQKDVLRERREPGQDRPRDLDVLVPRQAADGLDRRIVDRGEPPAELDQGLALDLADQEAQDVVENLDLLVVQALGVVEEEVGHPSQRLDAVFQEVVLDRPFELGDERFTNRPHEMSRNA